jgi:hypothetical protein
MYDFVKKQRRDLLAEACADMRSYQSDGGAARHQLANSKGVGVPVQGAKVPSVLRIEQVDGRWYANDKTIGPFDTVRDLEMAVYGRSELSAAKRDWRDDAKPADE